MAPNHARKTRIHERAIFEAFCAARGVQIASGSIEQPAPPAPDLIATLIEVGRVAFELVRLDDAEELAGMSRFQQAVGLLEREFAALTPKRRKVLSQRLSDAEVTIHFRSSARANAGKGC
jgi:hypothetical protein